MEILYYTKLNKGVIKQHSVQRDYNTHHRPQFCRPDIFKKSVNNMGIKLYNMLPSYIKKLEDIQGFKKELKLSLLKHTFYSAEEYLSYEYLLWRM
jgi:hypothetical protein